MTDFTRTRPHIYVSGAVILAANHNENELEILDGHNASMHATTGHLHDGATGNGTVLRTMPTLVPIGSIIPFYDFNGGLTFNTTYWAYCNGQVKNVGALVAQTLPDLSGRYLVGFGTEGGADNGSAAWATAAVGNASHQIDISHTHTSAAHTHTMGNHTHNCAAHTHTVASHTHTSAAHTHTMGNHTHTSAAHTHTMGNHTHTGPSHTHTQGDLTARAKRTGGILFYQTQSTAAWDNDDAISASSSGSTVTGTTLGIKVQGTTDSAGTGNTGAPSTNTTDSTTPGVTGGPSTNTTDSTTPGVTGGTALTSDSTSPGASGVPSTNTTDSTTPGATGSSLSATQSIQPSSVRVRFIMRIL